jgi:DNA mismatch endonuclease (patch repair protein)
VVLTRARIAVFIDGCFWHGCALHGTLPKNNREWWTAKLWRTAERDRRKDAELVAMGWLPLHFWEHEQTTDVVNRIVAAWGLRTGRT